MHPYPPHRRRDYTEPCRWQPLADEEWDELLPFVLVQNRPGRPLRDARKRMDAIFWIAASGAAWHTLPPRFGKADTVARHFRRLAQAGLWERLLRAPWRGPTRPLPSAPWSTGSAAPAAAPPGSGACGSSPSPGASVSSPR